MLFIVVFASLVATVLANVTCGRSKYADAGEMPLPSGFAIIGGQEARPHEFPWQVDIRDTTRNAHICGGTIIHERWVVTAAHCIHEMIPEVLKVVVGEHNVREPSTVRKSHEVEKIIKHENFSYSQRINDIAVVKVYVPFRFNENITRVCAPIKANLYAHWKSQASGWGKTSSSGVCCVDTLRYVTLNITTNEYCDQVYTRRDITDDNICTTDNRAMIERDACTGDSGGPLTVKYPNGQFALVGVISWGDDCANGLPGVYARVGYHLRWILDKINSN